MKPYFSSSKGFTLIEMLSTVVIASLIFAAMASFLFSAFKVIKVLDPTKAHALEGSVIALEKISREIQQSPVYPEIAFEGTKDRVSFPEISSDKDSSLSSALNASFKLGQVQQVEMGSAFEFKRVSYFFDRSQKSLMKQVGNQDASVVLEHIEDVVFLYAFQSTPESGISWQESTAPSTSSAQISAMMIRLSLDKEFARPNFSTVEKTFLLARVHPVGSLLLQTEES